MNASEILFRASSVGKLMTRPQSGGGLSKTCTTYLQELFVEKVYGRKKLIISKYIEKGLMVEEQAVTLYSRVKKTFFRKNEERLFNEFVTGIPDTFEGKSIHEADATVDMKSSWDLFTFSKTKFEKVDADYYWQGQTYMALTGAKVHKLIYCLIDTPDVMVQDEKRKLSWKMGLVDQDTNDDYLEACAEIDRLSNYSDIPMGEKINEIIIDRDEKAIASIYERVEQCREWMDVNLFKAYLTEAKEMEL